MTGIEYWHLCDQYTVVQAALLIIGENPDSTQYYIESWDADKRPMGYDAVKTALLLLAQRLKVPTFTDKVTLVVGNVKLPAGITTLRDLSIDNYDAALTRLTKGQIVEFLREKGFTTNFFFPESSPVPDYLRPEHPHYAPKLAAAVRAWSVSDRDFQPDQGKTVRQNLEQWLRKNAADYGLLNDDGTQNESAIREITKIANWKAEGGAPKTPGRVTSGY